MCNEYTNTPHSLMADEDICSEYLSDLSIATGITVLASVFVFVINYGIGFVILSAASFEKHHSLDSREKSVFLRILLLRFVNMGCIFLVNQDRYRLSELMGMTYVHSPNMSSEWYFTVGTTVVLVQLLECVGQNVLMLCYYWWRERKKRIALTAERALSQAELNAVYLGPEFILSTRYANVISTFFVCYMYAAGIPVLMVIAGINFSATYWVDKFLFISLYRTPARQDSDISRLSTKVMKMGVFVHLLMTIWIFCQQSMFQTDLLTKSSFGEFEYVRSLVAQKHIVPYFLLLVLSTFSVVCYYLFHKYCIGTLDSCVGPDHGVDRESIRMASAKAKSKSKLLYTDALKFGR